MGERTAVEATRRCQVWVALALLAGACATGPAEFLRRPAQPIGWPATDPRIEVVLAYHDDGDIRRSPGFWARLASLFGAAEEEPIVSPYGLALVGDETLAIADAGLGIVHELSLRTGAHEILSGTKDVPLETPIGVAAAPDGRLFVTDSARGRVVVFAPGGDLVAHFGSPEEMGRPTGIAYDRRHERLLITDTTGCRILAYRLDGTRIGAFGKRGKAPGEFNYPTNVALAPGGEVLVTDSMNFRVQILSASLQPLRQFGIVGRGPGTFASPKGIASDSEGNIYVVDAMFDNVQVFDSSGRLLLAFGSSGTGLGQLYLPSGIMIDEHDRLFVSDAGNARFQVFQFHASKR